MIRRLLFILLIATGIQACASTGKMSKKGIKFANKQLTDAAKQYSLLLKKAYKAHQIPRTVTKSGKIKWVNNGFDWTMGFFPGSCWYLYEFTDNKKWKKAAENFQSYYVHYKHTPHYMDIGFIFNASYGNGYRLTGNEKYKKILITAAKSLSKRFNPKVGAIKSWDVDHGWQSKRGWQYPVIIDNMMNLELLFKASKFTGNPKFKNIAVSHANVTLKNFFRSDNSSYHVVDFDSTTGKVRSKGTAQGYSAESSWARGQAWGLYGFTMCYRYTHDKKYLKQAQKIAKYIINTADPVPYWDYDDPDIPNAPRDASAAAITASALIELNSYSKKNYLKPAGKILHSLASPHYKAKIGSNHDFLLKHSVGALPFNNEINVPLNYTDYYYIEALLRYKKELKNEVKDES
jgi:rhamnogalacturonyl hydrolase YesR